LQLLRDVADLLELLSEQAILTLKLLELRAGMEVVLLRLCERLHLVDAEDVSRAEALHLKHAVLGELQPLHEQRVGLFVLLQQPLLVLALQKFILPCDQVRLSSGELLVARKQVLVLLRVAQVDHL